MAATFGGGGWVELEDGGLEGGRVGTIFQAREVGTHYSAAVVIERVNGFGKGEGRGE